MATRTELPRRHRAFLKQGSHETYFADSAAEGTDNPGNRVVTQEGCKLAVARQATGIVDVRTAVDATLRCDLYPGAAATGQALTSESVHADLPGRGRGGQRSGGGPVSRVAAARRSPAATSPPRPG